MDNRKSVYEEEIEAKNDLVHKWHQRNIQPYMPTVANYHYQTQQQSFGNSSTTKSSLYQPHSVEGVLDLSRRRHNSQVSSISSAHAPPPANIPPNFQHSRSNSLDSSRNSSTPSPQKNSFSYGSGSPTELARNLFQETPQQAPPTVIMPPNHLPCYQFNKLYHSHNSENLFDKSAQVPGSTTITPSAIVSQLNYSRMPATSSVIVPVAAVPVSINQTSPALPIIIQQEPVRPFKPLLTDPLVPGATFDANDSDSEDYAEFRKRILQRRESEKSTPKRGRTNSHSSRNSETTIMSENEDWDSNASNAAATSSGQVKDVAYFMRRQKNNIAAKESRDRRRKREGELAIRSLYLDKRLFELEWVIKQFEKENATLEERLAARKSELISYQLIYGPIC